MLPTLSQTPKMIRDLEESLGEKSKRLPREIKVAVNRTARKVKALVSTEIRKQMNIKAAALKRRVQLVSLATPITLRAEATLSKGGRIPLRDFSPRQNKKGVKYKPTKTGSPEFVVGGFMGPKPGQRNARWGGKAYKREGKSKYPIKQLYGPSPWGVFRRKRMRPEIQRQIRKELQKQIKRRIRFNVMKREGKI